MGIIQRIKQIIINRKIKTASPREIAELMRGKFYYLGNNVRLYTHSFGTEPYLISIHDNVTCAAGVSFVNHDVSCFNMARVIGLDEHCLDKVGPITLKENCFVGAFSVLMPGCSVGINSVIAACSVVTKNVPDNEVWGGIPAHFIMTVEEYARKTKENAMKYPWIDKSSMRVKSMLEPELIKARQRYFFENQPR